MADAKLSNGGLHSHNRAPSKEIRRRSLLLIRATSATRLLLLLLALHMSCTIFRFAIPLYLSPDRRFLPCTMAGNPALHSQGEAAPSKSKRGMASLVHKKEREETEEGGEKDDGGEFWRQPDGLGFRPCLNFSEEYRRSSRRMMEVGGGEEATMRRRFLMVVVSGGLNQQRNQIVDAVVIARILEAALVIPILQVNAIWGDESEFADIFDEVRFKKELKDDVRVVSSLPPNFLTARPSADSIRQFDIDEQWILSHFLGRMKRNRVLLLRGLDSRLSKDLGPDLQKLRCKVAFSALQFRPAIQAVGNALAARMAEKGPYLALHLRLEKDVWVRTGCLPGLGAEADRVIHQERTRKPRLLTSRIDMLPHQRYLAGLCPLRATEIVRLLKALGASASTRIYLAGGQPFGGEEAVRPLLSEFPKLYNKTSLAMAGEIEQFEHQPSVMAALDYIVCLKSQVFMANHGGNMQRAMQGHRAYLGHRKHITPQKKGLVQLFMGNYTSTTDEQEVHDVIRKMHEDSVGAPSNRTDRKGRDVIAYPVPECMCR
ncbi:O-fucosyltransferase 20-like [Nymphaea colorata]|nr:O-fucosyltransferase 20-like [Nymphaea colorata]